MNRLLVGAVAVVIASARLSAALGAEAEAPLALALKQAAQDGRPVLAIGARNTCPLCAAFKQYVASDASLKPLLANYIVVVSDIDSNASGFQDLMQRRHLEGNLLPAVYIVRADGEVINGAMGLKPDGGVVPMLREGLAKSGSILGPKESSRLVAALAKAQHAVEQDNPAQALSVLAPAAKMQGFAQPLTQAHQLLEQISKQAETDVAECQRLVEEPDKLLEAAVATTEANRKYVKLPDSKKALSAVLGKINQQAEGKTAIAQAQEIVKARNFAHLEKIDAASRTYKQIIDKYPQTPAADLAEAELKALADKPVEPAKKKPAKEAKISSGDGA